MIDLTLTANEERAVRQALTDLPKVCRYHGDDLDRTGMRYGVPNCKSCRIPWRAREAWKAYTAALDRRDDAQQVRVESVRRLAGELRDVQEQATEATS
jgi:2-hydroxychromene-2-carboxylate isomerase